MGEGSPGVERENGAGHLRSDWGPSGVEGQQRIWAMGGDAGAGSGRGQIRSGEAGIQGSFSVKGSGLALRVGVA